MGERRFDGSDFTKAVWRGATFLGTDSLAEQFQRLREFFDENDHALAYLYWPGLDRTGHSSGVNSEAWIRRLEDLDQQLRELDSVLRDEEGLVITADHGMLDVSDERKLMVPETSALLHSVTAWAANPGWHSSIWKPPTPLPMSLPHGLNLWVVTQSFLAEPTLLTPHFLVRLRLRWCRVLGTFSSWQLRKGPFIDPRLPLCNR